MSDGERVTIYLIGQCLCAAQGRDNYHRRAGNSLAPRNSSVALEPDRVGTPGLRILCTLRTISNSQPAALTQNAFGLGRSMVQNGNGKKYRIPQNCPINFFLSYWAAGVQYCSLKAMTQAMTLRYTLRSTRDELVIPRSSCEKVIEATKAMASLNVLHHLQIGGIVDRDRRCDVEIQALRGGFISRGGRRGRELTLYPRGIGRSCSSTEMHRTDKPPRGSESRGLTRVRKQHRTAGAVAALAEVQFQLNGFGPKIGNMDAKSLESEMQSYLRGIQVGSAVAAARALLGDVFSRRDYSGALKYYNCKGILAFVSRPFQVSKEAYAQIVLGIIKEQPTGAVATAMKRLIDP